MAFSDFRSRLFLITPPVTAGDWNDAFVSLFEASLSSTRAQGNVSQEGDIGCVLIDGDTDNESLFAERAEPLVRHAQEKNVAVIIVNNGRLAEHLVADGIHVADPKQMALDEQAKLQDQDFIIGCGGINTRHLALTTGEREFDYLFFGRLDREATPDTHPKTVALSLWWAQMMAVPCVAMAGTSDVAFKQLAKSGVEFLAVREQVWGANDPAAEVIRLNKELDAIAQTRMAEAAASKATG